jgi:sortase (surface protein transpeptidase)
MQAPQSYYAPGWLQIGPKPGEPGTAIISGHYDDTFGKPGIFYYLKYLNNGDVISVGMANGTVREFAVTGLYELDPNQNAITYIVEQSKEPTLNLLTCHGVWYGGQTGYSKRLLVKARAL